MAVRKTKTRGQKKVTDVEAYMRGLDPTRRKESQAIRRIILGVNPKITEEIKWAAPSFALGEHFVTFNAWARDYVQLIFHHGPKKATSKGKPVDDPGGHLTWLATDRASMTFDSMNDIRSKKAALESIVKQWIKAMKAASSAAAKIRS